MTACDEAEDHRAGTSTAPGTGTARFQIEDLMHGAREAIIVHKGEDYRLRITSKGKLILTK